MCRNRSPARRVLGPHRPFVARALLSFLVLLAPIGAEAQAVVVDEGTFSLFIGGVRVGREDFSIRPASGTGNIAYVAQGIVLHGEDRVSVRLNTDSLGSPLRFTLEATRDGRLVESISGEARQDLWSGRAIRPDGESAREFRLPPRSLAAEAMVIHHLWFLLRFGEGRSPSVLHPRSLTVERVSIEDAGPDRVSLGLREFVTRKWVIRPVHGTAIREAWTDLEGRLLRVRVPAEDLEAVRDEAPPETPAMRTTY